MQNSEEMVLAWKQGANGGAHVVDLVFVCHMLILEGRLGYLKLVFSFTSFSELGHGYLRKAFFCKLDDEVELLLPSMTIISFFSGSQKFGPKEY